MCQVLNEELIPGASDLGFPSRVHRVLFHVCGTCSLGDPNSHLGEDEHPQRPLWPTLATPHGFFFNLLLLL